MIIAIEGTDCAGKTTLFEKLAERFPYFVHVRRRSMTDSSMACVKELVASTAHLWEQLYDSSKVYLCDRFFAVSGPVYDGVYNRLPSLFPEWESRVRVVYLEPNYSVVLKRLRDRGDPIADELKVLRARIEYKAVLWRFKYAVFSEPTVEEVSKCMTSWLSEQASTAPPSRV